MFGFVRTYSELWAKAGLHRKPMKPEDATAAGVAAAKHGDGTKV